MEILGIEQVKYELIFEIWQLEYCLSSSWLEATSQQHNIPAPAGYYPQSLTELIKD